MEKQPLLPPSNETQIVADTEDIISILMIGNRHVGKKSFLGRLTLGHYASVHTGLPSITDLHQPIVFSMRSTKRCPTRLEFYEIASIQSGMNVLEKPDMIVMCFAVNDRSSLEALQQEWITLVNTDYNLDEALPVMMLGLKRDLREAGTAPGGVREGHVLPQEAVRVAGEMRVDGYAECSAVTGELVKEVWQDLVKMATGTRTAGGGKTPGTTCVIL